MKMSVDMDNGRTGDYEREQYEVEVSSLTDLKHSYRTFVRSEVSTKPGQVQVIGVLRSAAHLIDEADEVRVVERHD